MNPPALRWMAVPALAAGVLLLAGTPAFAADTAPVYNVTQEGMTTDQGAKLADAFGIDNSRAARRRFGFIGKDFGDVPADDRRRGQGRVRPPDDLAGAGHEGAAGDQAALRRRRAAPRGAQLPELVGVGGDLKADADASRTPSSRRPTRGQADRQLRARHVGLLRPHARRPAGLRPGREAADHDRRRRQRDPGLDRDAPARARPERADHLVRRGRQAVHRALRRATSARARRRSATCCRR